MQHPCIVARLPPQKLWSFKAAATLRVSVQGKRPNFRYWDELKIYRMWNIMPSPRSTWMNHFLDEKTSIRGWITTWMNHYHLIPRIIEKTCHGCRYWEHGPFTATKSGTASITAHGVDVQNPDIAARALAFELSLARLTPVPNKNPGIMPIFCIQYLALFSKICFQ